MRNRIAKNRRSRNAAILTATLTATRTGTLTTAEKQQRSAQAALVRQEKLQKAAEAAVELERLSPVVHHYCPFRAEACRGAGVAYGEVGVGTAAGNELPDHIRSTEMRLGSADSTCFISPARMAVERGAERAIRERFVETKRQDRQAS